MRGVVARYHFMTSHFWGAECTDGALRIFGIAAITWRWVLRSCARRSGLRAKTGAWTFSALAMPARCGEITGHGPTRPSWRIGILIQGIGEPRSVGDCSTDIREVSPGELRS